MTRRNHELQDESEVNAPGPTNPGRRRLLSSIVATAGLVAGADLLGKGASWANPAYAAVAGDTSQPTQDPDNTFVPLAASAGVAYITLAGYHFQPVWSSMAFGWAGRYGAKYQISGVLEYFWVPLNLPQGSSLVSCTFYLVVNDAHPAQVTLNQLTLATSGGGVIRQSSVSTMSPSVQTVDLTFTPVEIDNTTTAYMAGWKPGAIGTAHQICGVRVGYQFETYLPLVTR